VTLSTICSQVQPPLFDLLPPHPPVTLELTSAAHAQGAASALEDAAALGVLLSSPPSATLETRLTLFQALRLPRLATTQILSSTNQYFTMAGLDQKTAEIRKFYKGPFPPWPECGPFSYPIREFFYEYDVFEQAGKVLEFREEGEVPEGMLEFFGDMEGGGRMRLGRE